MIPSVLNKLIMNRKITYILFVLAISMSSVFAQNDACADAIDISSIFGGDFEAVLTSSVFDNTTATTGADDPTAGYECFLDTADGPTLENTIWFSFVGDGEAYFVNTGDCGATADPYNVDTQIAIYTGTCGALVPYACNEDEPGTDIENGPWPAGVSFATIAGETYTIMIDGWAGTVGQFCINAMKIEAQTCADITNGEYGTEATAICFNEALLAGSTVAPVIPLTTNLDGFLWIISTEAPTGAIDPTMNPGYVGAFPILPAQYTISFLNDATQVPVGDYYFIPVVFGDALINPDGTIDWDSACIAYGEAILFTLQDELDPLEVDFDVDDAAMEITLDISGGSGAYDVAWEDGSTEQVYAYDTPGLFEVSVTDSSGCLETETLTIDALGSGIADAHNSEVSVFPNPAQDHLIVNWANSAKEIVSYRIVNLLGQEFQAQSAIAQSGSVQLDVSELTVGQYFIVMKTSTGDLLRSKFVVER